MSIQRPFVPGPCLPSPTVQASCRRTLLLLALLVLWACGPQEGDDPPGEADVSGSVDCTEAEDCGPDSRCEDGVCTPTSEASETTDTSGGVPGTNSEDGEHGASCEAGRCSSVPTSPGPARTACRGHEDCGSGLCLDLLLDVPGSGCASACTESEDGSGCLPDQQCVPLIDAPLAREVGTSSLDVQRFCVPFGACGGECPLMDPFEWCAERPAYGAPCRPGCQLYSGHRLARNSSCWHRLSDEICGPNTSACQDGSGILHDVICTRDSPWSEPVWLEVDPGCAPHGLGQCEVSPDPMALAADGFCPPELPPTHIELADVCADRDPEDGIPSWFNPLQGLCSSPHSVRSACAALREALDVVVLRVADLTLQPTWGQGRACPHQRVAPELLISGDVVASALGRLEGPLSVRMDNLTTGANPHDIVSTIISGEVSPDALMDDPDDHRGWNPRIIWDAELELARWDWLGERVEDAPLCPGAHILVTVSRSREGVDNDILSASPAIGHALRQDDGWRIDWPDHNRISCFYNDFPLRHVDIRSFEQLREFAAACEDPVDDPATVVPMCP